jgi:hypothetical protein
VGWVHSCYDHIINIHTPTGRLLTLQGEGSLKSPLALSVAWKLDEALPLLPVGALVVRQVGGVAAPPAALKLILDGAQEWDGRLSPLASLTASGLYRNADELGTWVIQNAFGRGLAPLLLALQGKGNDLSPLGRKVLDVLRPLLAYHQLSTASLIEVAARVLGLGEGLTPSGDDLLVGLLSVLHITGRLNAVLPTPMRPRFLKEVMARTSDLSAEFIRCALEGDFAEPVVLLARSLFDQEPYAWPLHATSLAATGHSSGIDAMVGMVLGCRLVASSRVPKVI